MRLVDGSELPSERTHADDSNSFCTRTFRIYEILGLLGKSLVPHWVPYRGPPHWIVLLPPMTVDAATTSHLDKSPNVASALFGYGLVSSDGPRRNHQRRHFISIGTLYQ
jgi:hypothetical protein